MTMRADIGGLTFVMLATLFQPGVVRAEDEPGKAIGRPPNVVVILADDLGFSDLGCYGGEIQTPNLDALAAGGLRFTQFYNTARCWPTRAALLTGYYPQQVRRDTVAGVLSGASGVRPKWARLLPEMLRRVGYRSYHAGKWHVDGMPLANGFDHSYYVQDLGRYFHPRVHFEDDLKLPPVAPGSGYYTTAAIADHAVKDLKAHAEGHAGRPFFLYLAFNAPHFPLQALPEDIARYRERYSAGWEVIRASRRRRVQDLGLVASRLSDVERDVGPPYDFPDALKALGPGEVNRLKPWHELTDEQRAFQATKMTLHAAMIDRMDREIGRVLDQIRAMGAFEDTLIVFLSDNGASAEIMVRDEGHDPSAPPGSAATYLCLGPGWSTVANTPFRRHKTWVHEGGIATPLIVHWPRGVAAQGELRHDPSHIIDLVPTILDIARAHRFETWDGQPVPAPPGSSLVPTFARDAALHHGDLWWEHEGNRAIRVGDWKLVAAGKDGPWELYDLASDRTETRDLARERPETARELEQRWRQRRDEFAALATRDLQAGQGAEPGPPVKELILQGESFLVAGRSAFILTPPENKRRNPQPWNPIERVGVLAERRVPALLIHGDEDKVVPLKENSAELVARYRAAGAADAVTLIVAKGQGHNFWEGFFHCQSLVDFAIERARTGSRPSARAATPRPQVRVVHRDGVSVSKHPPKAQDQSQGQDDRKVVKTSLVESTQPTR
jgi:arylsulfatase A-like enzyme